MRLSVEIPDTVYQAIQQGAGRIQLQRRFQIADGLARYYLQITSAHQTYSYTKTALVLADLHVPYHQEAPLETTLLYGIQYDPDEVVLLGDGFDFYKISFWKKDPSRMRFPDEVQVCKNILKDIVKSTS